MKYIDTANILEERIQRGDYICRKLPVESELIKEFGISRVTVRKAIDTLIGRGILARQPNAGVKVAEQHRRKRRNICFLAPAFPCIGYAVYLALIERAAIDYDVTIRPVDYVYWNDPVIRETLNSFDGVFFIPLAEDMPEPVRELLRKAEAGVVVFDCDLTGMGIPSIFAYPPKHMVRMLDYLYSLGHRRIVGLNTQPEEPLTRMRLDQWLLWEKTRGLDLRLINRPVEPYGLSWVRAYEIMCRELDSGTFDGTALLCTTQAVAIGATRAFHEHGITVGRDVSVCSINDDGISQYLCPSLTCFLLPEDLVGYLRLCLEWMMRDKLNWIGPLEFQSAQDTLFAGETTAACSE